MSKTDANKDAQLERTTTSSSQKETDEKKNDTDISFFQQAREVCESLIVALFLAFLFKTFEAEAFVIPTGSMAPTLKGRHKDVECSQCGYPFQTSASEEVDSSTNRRNGRHVVAGTCPQCGYTQYFGDEVPDPSDDKIAPSYTGDRILVSKLQFDFHDLKRFDVSVFRSPAEPRVNFIKRIVGLPNENLRIQYGDLFVQKDSSKLNSSSPSSYSSESETSPMTPDVDLASTSIHAQALQTDVGLSTGAPFEIARKDYRYLRQIMQVVNDADYAAPALEALGWPSSWTPDDEQGWVLSKDKSGRSYSFGLSGVDEQISMKSSIGLSAQPDVSPVIPDDVEFSWLRYRHIVPSSNDWYYICQGKLPPDVIDNGFVSNNPRLIDDFSCYNAGIARTTQINRITNELEWSKNSSDEFAVLTKEIQGDVGERFFCAKNPDGLGCNWVGDLGVSCDLIVDQIIEDSGSVVFDLVKGGVVFRCVLALKQGIIALDIPQIDEFSTVSVPYVFTAKKRFHVEFYNVDEEMRVVVNGREIVFPDSGGRYDSLTISSGDSLAPIPRNRDPNERDLSPVAIGVRGVKVTVERLKILRDVYYIAAGRGLEKWDVCTLGDFGSGRCDRLAKNGVYWNNESEVARFMSSPEMWDGYGNTKSALLQQREGQFVALGDNSGFSLDSRLWSNGVTPHYVSSEYLIGKAFYVYWPHGLPLPVVKSPFWPNFGKMRHID